MGNVSATRRLDKRVNVHAQWRRGRERRRGEENEEDEEDDGNDVFIVHGTQ